MRRMNANNDKYDRSLFLAYIKGFNECMKSRIEIERVNVLNRWAISFSMGRIVCVCESVGKKVSAANLILVILFIFPLLLLCSFLQRNHSKRTYSFIECCLFDRQTWWLHHISNIHQVYKEYGVSVSRGIRQHFTNEMIANETSKHTHTAPQIVYSADIQLKLVNSYWFVNFLLLRHSLCIWNAPSKWIQVEQHFLLLRLAWLITPMIR